MALPFFICYINHSLAVKEEALLDFQNIIVLVIAAMLIAALALLANVMKENRRGAGKPVVAGEIDEHTTIRELLSINGGVSDVLSSYGMHCAGCPSASDEELCQACSVHNLDVDEVLSTLKEYLSLD